MNKNLVTEKELIGKIKELRQIKPSKEWVFLTKNRILGHEAERSLAPFGAKQASIGSVLRVLFLRPALKPAYAGVLILFIIFGLFGFAQNSMPGDYLFAFKKVAEKGQTFFASEQERQQMSLELANKRLEELTQIVDTNQTKKLAPAIREFQGSLVEAFSNADVESLRRVVDIRRKTKELQSRGVVIEEDGLKVLELESFAGVLENLITDLENRTLTTKQEVVLDRMKELFDKGEYSSALELYLRNQ